MYYPWRWSRGFPATASCPLDELWMHILSTGSGLVINRRQSKLLQSRSMDAFQEPMPLADAPNHKDWQLAPTFFDVLVSSRRFPRQTDQVSNQSNSWTRVSLFKRVNRNCLIITFVGLMQPFLCPNNSLSHHHILRYFNHFPGACESEVGYGWAMV